MNDTSTSPRRTGTLRVLGALLLAAVAGAALATPTRGTQFNNWCAKAPVQATAPQQSRPYQAAGSACSVCHTSGNPSRNDLNAPGSASASCSGSGTATTCGAAINAFCIATPPANATITAPAAGTTVAQGSSLTFSAGNATNPDGFPLAYNWSFSGGLPAVSGQSVAVPMSVAGSVTATLQVRNSVGMLATGSVPTRSVNVTGTANQAPTASIVAPAANVAIAAGASVAFQGSGSDPDGNTPLSYAWSFPGGNPASSTAPNPGSVSYATAGSYTASLVVRDSLGLASTTVSRTVSVGAAANQPPSANIVAPAANVSIAAGSAVTFQGNGSDPDGNTPLSWAWSFPGGNPASSTAQNPGSVSYATAGTYTASLVVRDSLGLASTAATRSVTVTAAGGNLAPIASIVAPAADLRLARGASVAYQGSGSDPDNNTPLRYRWSFPGGSPSSSTLQNPGNVAYATAGTYTTTLVVTDSRGLASTAATRVVTVVPPQPPLATILAPAADASLDQGGSVSFQGGGSDPDNNLPLSYAWSFPGGTPATSTAQNPPPIFYNRAGSFVASLVVRDRGGLASAAATRTVTVRAVKPLATIAAPSINVSVMPGGAVSFRGSGSGFALPLTYRWSFAGGSIAGSTLQNPGPVRFSGVGPHAVTLVVTDAAGTRSEPMTRMVTVAAPNRIPAAVGQCSIDDDEHDDEHDHDGERSRRRDHD